MLNISETDHKYQHVWKRALTKIRTSKCFNNLKDEIGLFGTSSQIIDFNSQIKPNINKVIEVITHKKEAFRRLQTEGSEQFLPWYLISSDSTFRKVWSISIALAFLYTAIMMPYRLAFYDPVYFDFWTILELIIDGIFIIDIALTFFTPVTTKEGTLNTKMKTIAWSYIKTWFIIDLIASMPFSLIDYTQNTESSGRYNNFLRLIRLPRLYKLLRVARVMKAFKHYFNNESMDRLQDLLKINSRVHKLVKFLFTVCLCTHVMACIWYYSAKIQNFEEDTWVFQNQLLDSDPSTAYIASTYWAFTTLTTVGYGDIHATNALEQILSMMWMCVGVIVYSVTIGSLSSFLSSIDTKDSLLASKMAAIHEFANETGISKEDKVQIQNSIRYNIQKAGTVSQDKHKIFSELPRNLKYQVAMSIYNGFAKDTWFFKDRDPSFVISVVQLLRPLKLSDDEFLYREGEFPDEVYFILKGRVNLVVKGGCSYKSYLKNSHIGEIEILLDIDRRETSAQIFGDSDFLAIAKNEFLVVLNEFYHEKELLTEVARKRRKLNLHERNILLKLIEIKLSNGDLDGLDADNPILVEAETPMLSETDHTVEDVLHLTTSELGEITKRLDCLDGRINDITEAIKHKFVIK